MQAVLIGLVSLASVMGLGLSQPIEDDAPAGPRVTGVIEDQPADPELEDARWTDARALIAALGESDASIDTMTGNLRLTAVQALEGDTQSRLGRLAMRTQRAEDSPERRQYAVAFSELRIDRRVQDIEEHFIFDGRWLVERLPEERQFIKRELVPAGEELDPMALMRDAPFWVSIGRDGERVLDQYDAKILSPVSGLEAEGFHGGLLSPLQQLVVGCVQLELRPKVGTPGEDDWEFVRMWFDETTLLPRMYLKGDWDGDLQVVELYSVKTNDEVPAEVFDTETPPVGSGWQVQISPWRGKADG